MQNTRTPAGNLVRNLGRSGIRVSPICLGGNVFGWTADEKTSFKILDAFVDAGFNFIDTADMYSGWAPGHVGGESETVIGRWLKRSSKRDKVVIATKVGHDQSKRGPGLKRDNLLRCAEESLERLGIECIDVYLSHRDDLSTPVAETLETYGQLHKQGKIRAIGASDFSIARLKESLETSRKLGLPRYEVVQPEYNLLERDKFEGPLAALCAQEGLGAMTYFGLARGFLSGKYRSEADLGKSPRGPGIVKYMDERGMGVLAALDEVAETLRAPVAAVALAWVIAQPGVTAPIASVTSLEQLQELIAAARLSLTDAQLARLDGASRS